MRLVLMRSTRSTQLELVERVTTCDKSDINFPFVIRAYEQTGGVGSRGNKWDSVDEGLYLSFSIPVGWLDGGIPRHATSIYFGMFALEVVREFSPEVWLKWPNDLYLSSRKVGGVMTQVVNGTFVCGVGINISDSQKGSLLIGGSSPRLLFISILEGLGAVCDEGFLRSLTEFEQGCSDYNEIEFGCVGFSLDRFKSSMVPWGDVFSKYKLEFQRNQDFSFNSGGRTYSARKAILQDDGSISVDNEVFYSLR